MDKDVISADYDTLRKHGAKGLLSLSMCRQVGLFGIEVLTCKIWDQGTDCFPIIIRQERDIAEVILEINGKVK